MLTVLLVCAALLVASVLCYAMATAAILGVTVRLVRSGFTGRGFLHDVAAMTIVTFITAAAHLAAIALWAVAVRLCAGVATFEQAFYCSAENYTALGYGDVILPGEWRLLGPLEAINGLLQVGLSTALMFAVMHYLIVNHLRSRYGAWEKRGGDRETTP